MRKPLVIGACLIGAVVVVVAGLFIYAAVNLNSIIADNQQRVLERASAALGRKVEIRDIHASIGWGITAELSGIQIAEAPEFGGQPFVEADSATAAVAFLPLLRSRIHISSLTLKHPQIRIVRAADGRFNVSTLGEKRVKPETAAPRANPAQTACTSAASPLEQVPPEASRKGGAAPRALEHLHVRELTIEDGRATYVDNGAQPVMLDAINLKVTDFNISSPFEVELELAALSDSRNVAFSGHIGPLVNQAGVINPGDVSLYLQGSVGPIALDDLRKVALAAQAIPPALSIAAPVTMDATVNGRLDNFALDVKSDLSANAIAFDDRFNKPAGTPLTFLLTASHEATGPFLVPRAVELTLADLSARASNLELGAGKIAGRIDSNQFEIDSVTKLAPAAAKLGISGKAEIHSDLGYANGHESAKGKVALAGVAVTRPGTNAAALSNLSGDIVLDGQSADIGPLKFSLGSGAATLTAHASSLSPLSLDYQFSAATLRPADFVAKRPADEHLNQVSSKGTVAIRPSGPAVSSQLSSTSGTVNGVAYQNLALTASLDGHTLRLPALQLAAFGGSIAASGETQTAARAPFSTAINFSNVDLQQLLASQNSKAADSVRGIATGQAQVSGRTGSFEEMQPTLNGNGRLAVVNGKLIGINVAADGLKKVNNLPGIGSLIPAPVVANHPELFKNPDTDIDHMSLSFVLHGARVTSNDIVVKSQDYTVLGDGWFELNKRLNMSVKLQLSPPFSRELVQQKKAIGYLTNRSGQVDVPMQISGTLPKPLVVPDVAELAQRAATHAVESQGQKALGKLFGKKGASKFLGGIFGGDAH